MFSIVPGKVPKSAQHTNDYVWPQSGKNCEMNLFFREYDSAEGWLGESYLMIWDRHQIAELSSTIAESFSDKYHFFASDGGGNQFGFYDDNGKIVYVSAPNIGSDEDVRILGDWSRFICCLNENDYI